MINLLSPKFAIKTEVFRKLYLHDGFAWQDNRYSTFQANLEEICKRIWESKGKLKKEKNDWNPCVCIEMCKACACGKCDKNNYLWNTVPSILTFGVNCRVDAISDALNGSRIFIFCYHEKVWKSLNQRKQNQRNS